ncbi:MAG: FeoB-associated Cys-rich membrane protein [Faecalibacterium sp.]|nr:FeoB-associated Cys-rich membrane protein [Faecalibacterium sp.]
MMEFIATNFNLPTIIVAALVFGALCWVVWHTHKHGGGCSCGGDCSHCKGCH